MQSQRQHGQPRIIRTRYDELFIVPSYYRLGYKDASILSIGDIAHFFVGKKCHVGWIVL